MTAPTPWLALLFFTSGALGLVYQVLWTRSLTLTLGNSTSAVGLVIAVFMGGLALGSALAGRVTDRLPPRSALVAYGVLEAALGLWAAGTPLMFAAMHRGLIAAAGPEGVPFWWKAGMVVPVLLPPTMMMGATLPLICRAAAGFRGLAASFPLLYGINTVGATAGAFLAGFLALPTLGLRTTLLLAACGNVLVGAVSLLLARVRPQPPEPGSEEPARAHQAPGRAFPAAPVLAAALLSGAAAMAYEVAFTRALALSLGSSIYSFSLVLTLFLAGIGLGSLLVRRLRVAPALAFCACQAWMAISVAALLFYFPALPQLFLDVFPKVRHSFGLILAADFALAAPALLVPALLMGLSLPLLVQLGAGSYRRLGQIYAANTFGGIVASAAVALALLPGLGVEGTIRLAIGVNLAACAVVLAAAWREAPANARVFLATAVVATAAFATVVPSWSQQVMASGPSVYAAVLDERGLAPQAPGQVLFYRDGANSTVSVHQEGDVRYLRVNGKTDASTTPSDMGTQLMLGHLPLLVHPAPRRALVIGLGSGVTAGACTLYPTLQELDVAEIEPAMVQAAGFFAEWNRGALSHPAVSMKLNDGRNVLLESEPYDVLSVEPSNPWIAGIASLFTTEFYEICRERLAPGGVLCQWIHLNALEEPELRMVVGTFAEVFPHGQVWLGASKDLLLVAWKGEDPSPGLPGRLETLWRESPEIRRDLQSLGVEEPLAFYGRYLCEVEDLRPWYEGGRRNTDDLPLLEYLAPMNLYRAGKAEAARQILLRYRKAAFPPGAGLAERERALRPALAATARANRDPDLERWFLDRK